MKIAVIGANGQLGTDLCRVYRKTGYTVTELNHDIFDVTNFDLCHAIIKEEKPMLLVNTAAFHNVELCEENPSKAFGVNCIGARNLAIICKEFDVPLVHFSTDYVFDGSKTSPYSEDDYPLPLNVYGNTKLSGEIFIRTIADRYFVIRVSGLYGHSLCRAKGGLNFVRLMLKLSKERDEIRVVNNEVLSPTYTLDVAKQLERLTRTENYGLYHMASQDGCSWYDFAAKIFDLTGTKVKVSIARPDEFPAKVPRPKYSVLGNVNLRAIDLDIMPHWVEGLKRYLEDGL